MFDADLVLVDGTINLTSSTDDPAESTTVDEITGGAVIDLGESGVCGLAAVLIMPTAGATGATLDGFIEVSDTEDMTAATCGVFEVGKFGIASATKGRILAAEVPATVILRFATDKRYVRANLTVASGSDNFYKVKCYLTPFPFKVL